MESCCCFRFYGSLMRSVLLLDGLPKTLSRSCHEKALHLLWQGHVTLPVNHQRSSEPREHNEHHSGSWKLHQTLSGCASNWLAFCTHHWKDQTIFIQRAVNEYRRFEPKRPVCFCYATECSRLAGETHHCRWWAA